MTTLSLSTQYLESRTAYSSSRYLGPTPRAPTKLGMENSLSLSLSVSLAGSLVHGVDDGGVQQSPPYLPAARRPREPGSQEHEPRDRQGN